MLPNLSKLTLRQGQTAKQAPQWLIEQMAQQAVQEDAMNTIMTAWTAVINKINRDLADMAAETVDYTADVSIVINGAQVQARSQIRIAFMIPAIQVPTQFDEVKTPLLYKLAVAPVVQFYDPGTDAWRNIGWLMPIPGGDCVPGGVACFIDGDGVLRFEIPIDVDGVPLNVFYKQRLNLDTEFTEEDAQVKFTDIYDTNNEGLRQRFGIESRVVRDEWIRWAGLIDQAFATQQESIAALP